MADTKSYEVRTFGCQMNMHDSERLAGLLNGMGLIPITEGGRADVVVLNTCAVRENADSKLYGTLGHLASIKEAHPDMQIAVGGCLAQKDRETILKKAPYVDVVFGTHNIDALPILLERSRIEQSAQIEILESLETFPSALPVKRDSLYTAWVSISVGCNNTCTFCIVPALRGIEKDRSQSDILSEIRMLVSQGVSEITLLGQNVNAYGVDLNEKGAFAKLLRECGKVDGLERVRFMSPHPRDFSDDVIEAMIETKNVMPHLHMPLQSGSDEILRAMRRSYRAKRYLEIVDKVRDSMPDAAITTDIIVGFPGESEKDFQATLDVVESAQFDMAFTFKYSKRPGTPAATMENQVDPEVVSDRYVKLHAATETTAWNRKKRMVGNQYEVLVQDLPGRKDESINRFTGRAPDFSLVHFATSSKVRPGDYVQLLIDHAAPHHLVSDREPISIRKSAAGDLYEQGSKTSIPLALSTRPE